MLLSLLGAHTHQHKKVRFTRQVTLDVIFGTPHKSGSKRDFLNVTYTTINKLRRKRGKKRERVGMCEEEWLGSHSLPPCVVRVRLISGQ